MGDLARLALALENGEIVEAESLAAMTTPSGPSLETGVPYGLGLEEQVIGGHRCWGHSGYWGTTVSFCPGLDLAVTSMTFTSEWPFDPIELHEEALVALGLLDAADVTGR